MLDRLRKHGVSVRENNNPSNVVRQLFLFDPNGVQIEINFREVRQESPGAMAVAAPPAACLRGRCSASANA